ncbi:MAG TPA: serine/threonine protein phosphatase [Streptomyces sp.]|uniref:PP2C family protein-serine/threonine phosphatase n=2 Tax=Streptomyces TaxID=1883 RepID=A0ABU2RKI0_9ACTN|nr:PP2C family protein-serine/threonine phosphatase [Streptomyces sp. MBT51]MDT0429355.1 PP2C family protein-serine/threonine phosphatase [Streptomyces sp. DSM 41770]HBF82341.1 serine/threonine protein phosphatase [Streptomyces sp.]
MVMGLRRPAARRPALPGTDPGEAAAGAARIGNRALALWLVLLTAGVVLLDSLTGTDLPLIPLLVVLPALASVFCTVRQTVGVACWVTLVVVGSRIAATGAFWDVFFLIGFTVLACALGVVACAARIRHATEVARLRSAAVALQRQILRPLPVVTRQLRAQGIYEPIEEDRFVGGDIYEVVQSPHGTRVIIGDVQGKGLPAIGAGFAALGAFREAAFREGDLTAVAAALEDAVVRHNAFTAETGETERFVTALLLGFDGGDRVSAVNCGHLLPRMLHDGAATKVALRLVSVPLGMAELSGEARAAETFGFPLGAALVVFTDGVTEARDATGAFYPLDERLGRWARDEPRELLRSLQADLEEFSGGVRRDDVAVLVLTRRPEGCGGLTTGHGPAAAGPA